MQSGGPAAWPCGCLGLSAVTALAVVLAQNAPLEAERPWVRAFADAELLHRSFGLSRRFRGDASGSPHVLQSVRDRRSAGRDFPGFDGFPRFDGLLLSLPQSRS